MEKTQAFLPQEHGKQGRDSLSEHGRLASTASRTQHGHMARLAEGRQTRDLVNFYWEELDSPFSELRSRMVIDLVETLVEQDPEEKKFDGIAGVIHTMLIGLSGAALER